MRENKSLGKDSIHRCFLAATFSFHVSGKETYIMLKLPNVMCGTYRCKPEMNRQKFCSGNKVAAMSLQETHWPTMALPGQAVHHLLPNANAAGNVTGEKRYKIISFITTFILGYREY